MFWVFLWYHFPFAWRTLFQISFWASLLVMNSFRFYFFSSFWLGLYFAFTLKKNIFAGFRILSWQFLCCEFSRMLYYFLVVWPPLFLLNGLQALPSGKALFFSVCFQSLSVAFNHLILMCLGVVFLEFILFGGLKAFWTCKIYVFWHIWESLAIILWKNCFAWIPVEIANVWPLKIHKFWRSTVKHRA